MGRWNSRSVADWLCMPLSPFFSTKPSELYFSFSARIIFHSILILFIFAILLTSSKGDRTEPHDRRRVLSGAVTALAGLLITTWVTLKHRFLYGSNPTVLGDHETDMKAVGQTLMGTDKYEYLLSFEALSILLLVCAIGGILIARKR